MTSPATPPVDLDGIRERFIAEYPDFPKPGILFRDITPLLGNGPAFRAVIDHWASMLPEGIDHIVGTEARGFVFGAPLAHALGAGFVPVRKAGKLPGFPRSVTYHLEYGTATVEMAERSLQPGDRVVLVDDLLATGGTAVASAELIRSFEAELVAASFLIELEGLGGREALGSLPVTALWSFPN